ncbi:hypothetical protein [Citrobacter portucalensis]
MRLAPYPAYIAVAGFVGLISVAHQAHPSPDAVSALSGLHRYAGLVGRIRHYRLLILDQQRFQQIQVVH